GPADAERRRRHTHAERGIETMGGFFARWPIMAGKAGQGRTGLTVASRPTCSGRRIYRRSFEPIDSGRWGGRGAMTVEQPADSGQQALRAFERDLPRSWAERPGQWVAYQGERRLGFAAQKHELYHQCFAQGLSRGEFVVFCIEPLITE